MKFLVDAQLPRRLVYHLRQAGHDAVHTLDLPHGNRTTDADIIAIAAHEERIVVTKDADFMNSYIVAQQPEKLLLISTGNISNMQLEALLVPHLATIESAFARYNVVELTRTSLLVHT